MDGFSRQGAHFTGLVAPVVLAMVLMPIGQTMPCAPGSDSVQGVSASLSPAITTALGVFVEDDVEVGHGEVTVLIPGRALQMPSGTTGWLTSFLWTERLHRPPIA